MKTKLYLFIFILFSVPLADSLAQGCVAIRNMSSCSMVYDSSQNTKWQASANFRYFRSYKHFRGTAEEPDRVANGTEVINNDNSVILGLNYQINKKWSAGLALPLVYIDRSSLYEHDRINRYHTQSQGQGDLRLMGYYTLAKPHGKSHFIIGLGMKVPTGNYHTKDNFHLASGIARRPVDQSIQPGDGGWGSVTELSYIRQLSEKFLFTASGLYLINPMNTNGVRTYRETLNPILANESIMSVPDQFFARVATQYDLFKGLSVSVAGRMEGIPVRDLIGKSEGFRRPGYIVSAEPGVMYQSGKNAFTLNVPLALIRNRTQSVTDRETELAMGKPRHGDAAFADYLISFTYQTKF